MALLLGSLIAVLALILILTTPSPFAESAVSRREVRERTRFRLFYHNPDDPRLLVPTTPLWFPLTLNWARPQAPMLVVLAVCFCLVIVLW